VAPNFYNNEPVLKFHTEDSPSGASFWTRKGNIFSRDPSVGYATTPADAMAKQQKTNEAKAKRTTSKHTKYLVKRDHTAKELCKSKTSAGPSFVSSEDRQFCHMEMKPLYPFYENVDIGACFDNERPTRSKCWRTANARSFPAWSSRA
jgi:hypothetical protein